jgi:hypothetical protein
MNLGKRITHRRPRPMTAVALLASCVIMFALCGYLRWIAHSPVPVAAVLYGIVCFGLWLNLTGLNRRARQQEA